MDGSKNFSLFIMLLSYALFGIERYENLYFSPSTTSYYSNEYTLALLKGISWSSTNFNPEISNVLKIELDIKPEKLLVHSSLVKSTVEPRSNW